LTERFGEADARLDACQMDYTLVPYLTQPFESRAYFYSKEILRGKGFPVSGLNFDAELACRGLVIDIERGNLLKVDRFGFVRRAMHGTRVMEQQDVAAEYKELEVRLASARFEFLNTLFSGDV